MTEFWTVLAIAWCITGAYRHFAWVEKAKAECPDNPMLSDGLVFCMMFIAMLMGPFVSTKWRGK